MSRPGREFLPQWSVCWATTYTFHPAFFETFLLRRLGEPPLNTVVFADAGRLARLWADIPPDEAWRIRGANREYLVQPVAVGGAFHPKTILLANDRHGLLLVGSGNVGEWGMERGREVFARFDSSNDDDLPSFAVWRSWMGQLIERADAPLLRTRWADVRERTIGWLRPSTVGASLATNSDRPLIEALFDGVAGPVDELRVTAPFFDSGLGALRELVRRAAPKRITVIVGGGASVDGPMLRDFLAGAIAESRLMRFEPFDFVHAKLVALFQGDRVRVLSGSANLSSPALLGVPWEGGNAESGTIVELPRERGQSLFAPPGYELVEATDDDVLDLRFQPSPEEPALPMVLASAILANDGLITVRSSSDPEGKVLTDGTWALTISDGRTVAAAARQDHATLVWLTGPDGAVLSNRVPLADQAALERTLLERRGAGDRPDELQELDLQHPLGRLLAELHQTVLFDIQKDHIDRRPGPPPGEELDDDGFWDRLARDTLASDPRVARYATTDRERGVMADDLEWLLRQLLDEVPAPNTLRLLSGEVIDRAEVERQGISWSPEARLAVRAYNVLYRWCIAVADPRLSWISDDAAVRHTEMLLGVILRIWQQRVWIAEDRLVRLLETLFGALIQTERTLGYLASCAEEERASALVTWRRGPGPDVAAALAFTCLRVHDPARAFAWQPFLIPGLEWGVFDSQSAAALVPTLCDRTPSEGQVTERLVQVAAYTDDAHWCAAHERLLGLKEVRLAKVNNELYPLEVEIVGARGVLADPRVVTLAREALAYKRAPGLRIRAAGDLLTLSVGKPLYGYVGDKPVASIRSVRTETITHLETLGAGFGHLLADDGVAEPEVEVAG